MTLRRRQRTVPPDRRGTTPDLKTPTEKPAGREPAGFVSWKAYRRITSPSSSFSFWLSSWILPSRPLGQRWPSAWWRQTLTLLLHHHWCRREHDHGKATP